MKFISITLIPVALFLSLPLVAQGDTPHALAKEFYNILPRKAPSPTQAPTFSHMINWEKSADDLGSIIVRGKDMPVEPLAMMMMGVALFNSNQIEAAQAVFEDLGNQFADHPLLNRRDKNDVRLIDHYRTLCGREVAFRRTNTVRLLDAPELDPQSDTTINFSKGPIVVRLYKNVAPEHRKNFAKLAQSGYYDRVRIHRIVPGTLIQVGDPLSRERDASRWGQGGPDYVLENEFSLVTHRRGTITMYRGPGRPKSHGSQFQILLKDQPNLDFVQTPFAEVISGIDIIDAVSRQSANQYQAPVEEVYLNGIVLPPSMK